MSELQDFYVFSNGQLKRQDNTIYFIDGEGKKKSLPVDKVENLHLFGETQFNSSFLNLLNQYDINLHIYNYYGFYAGSYVPREKKVSGFVLVKQAEHYLKEEKRLDIARSFIESASFHILRNLKSHKEKTSDTIRMITEERKKLENANSVQEIMGIEGRIRNCYYQSFSQFLRPEFSMEKREKRPPTSPINALLSFGNSLMYTTVLTEIYKTQLNPTISYLHEPSVKRFSLSLDIAEIFKPLIVEPLIFSLINNRRITPKQFSYEHGFCLLNEEGRKRFIESWEKKMQTSIKHRKLKRQVTYRYLIRLECYKLIKHVIGDEKYKPLKAWW